MKGTKRLGKGARPTLVLVPAAGSKEVYGGREGSENRNSQPDCGSGKPKNKYEPSTSEIYGQDNGGSDGSWRSVDKRYTAMTSRREE